ncbi:hypothetical protein KY284_017503 [Solanum tuberosum]|nr:hypothetical protein KY284_017503 [Solanum tuberosum]
MSENGTAANIPVSENVSTTVENNSTVSIGDLQHSASTGSCSLTFTGISYSFITNVSDKLSPTWVVDSGATDHMTSLSHLFISYSPCPSYKKITIADGSVITVVGQGDISLGKSLILKDVLHIPKLSANLISIQKLTKDSKCQVTFFPSYCLFQEQNTKEMIGRASEKGGLYCLDFHNGEYISKNSLSSSFLSESIMSNKEKVWLYHRRLGHPSFYVIKRMFPSLFKDLIVESFHCDDCEIAKHKRTSFPISHKRCQTPFSLIHSDIWGPSPIPNISGARWFVSFIDDCTRVTWIYLLKQKSDGESLNGKEPLDLSLFDLSISSRAKSLPESPFLQSPESLNPNEPIESPNPNIDNGILENNLPLQVYSRRKRLTDQTTRLQSSPQVTAPDTHPEPVEPSETPNQTDHEEEFNQPNVLDLPIAIRKGTRTCTQHPLSLSMTYQNLSSSHKAFLCNLHTIPIPRNLSEALGN